jgi:hypothetical protein
MNWYEADKVEIKDLLDEYGSWLSNDAFNPKFKIKTTVLMTLHGLINSVSALGNGK